MPRPPDELIERAPDVARVAAAIGRVRDGDGALVFVEGPAGIGKSRLVGAAAGLAEARGLTVLRASGGELERDVTFGVARQLFERLLHDASEEGRAALLAGSAALAQSAVGGAPEAMSFSAETGPAHGLYWLASNLAQRGPVALVVDDAHWADPESLRFLIYLARRLQGLAVLLVIAARPRELGAESQLLDLLATEAGADRIALKPLSPDGATQLLTGRLGTDVPREVADACHEVTGGNPFFIQEIAATLDPEPGLETDAAVRRVRGLLPPAVMRSILLRLGRESADVRAVAVALAVVGDGGSGATIRAVAEVEPSVLVDALERLADAGLAARSGLAGLAHPIVRSAIYTDLPESRRRLLHRRAADALAAQGAAAEDVAQHLLLTEPDGDAATAAALLDTGRRALDRGASDTAIRLLTRALSEPPPVDERAPVLIALGGAELNTGAMADAAGHLREALERELPSPVRRDAALTLAQALVHAEGQQSAVDALSAAADQLEGDDALRVDIEQTSLSMYLAEHLGAAKERLQVYATLPGETPTERVALAAVSLAGAFDAGTSAAAVVPLAQRALGGGALIREQTTDSTTVSNAQYVLLYAEQLDEFDAGVRLGLDDARDRGSRFGFFNMAIGGQFGAALRGDTATVVAQGETARAAVPDLPGRLIVELWTSCIVRFSVDAHLRRGEGERARQLLAEAPTEHLDTLERCMVRYARGLVAGADGRLEDALTEFLAFGAFTTAVGWEVRDSPWRLDGAQAAAASGRAEQARALAAEASAIARVWGTPGGVGAALRVTALVGDPESAAATLTEAVGLLRTSPLRLHLADALVDLGIALRREGNRREARATLEEGLDVAARCGALRLAERARDELRVLGARPRRMAFSGVDSLTASERRVADLAAAGRTNREIAQALFVTPKTVEAHLGSVYRKLDISSRAALPETLAGVCV